MGVRTSLMAITPTNTEIADLAADGVDLTGQLANATQAVADAIEQLTVIQDFMPSGSNKTAIATQITALS